MEYLKPLPDQIHYENAHSERGRVAFHLTEEEMLILDRAIRRAGSVFRRRRIARKASIDEEHEVGVLQKIGHQVIHRIGDIGEQIRNNELTANPTPIYESNKVGFIRRAWRKFRKR